jgi:hypothetical protein
MHDTSRDPYLSILGTKYSNMVLLKYLTLHDGCKRFVRPILVHPPPRPDLNDNVGLARFAKAPP